MNISLTLNFDTVEQLEKFMLERKGGTNARTTAAVALKAVPDRTDAVAIADDDPMDMTEETPPGAVDDPMDMGEAIAQEEDAAVDYAAMRATLMSKLKALAGKMDDPKVLGVFINAFDVVKFSDLPDDRLVGFAAALTAEFG